MAKYVALLRGINVGGRTIKMDALRELFAGLGYKDVKTLLASGNVVFEAGAAAPAGIKAKIEKAIAAEFGLDVHIILRSDKELNALIKSAPFKNTKRAPKTQFYITFLSERPRSKLKIPFKTLEGDYEITDVKPGYVVSLIHLGAHGTVDAMAILEKEFGAQITTRNWNTVEKIHKLMDA
jgi:uncharacterized protein (DUF1697 family)